MVCTVDAACERGAAGYINGSFRGSNTPSNVTMTQATINATDLFGAPPIVTEPEMVDTGRRITPTASRRARSAASATIGMEALPAVAIVLVLRENVHVSAGHAHH